MKPARQQKKKTALKHRNQEKTRSKEGVIKTAQKPRASQEGVRQQLKLKKRYVWGRIAMQCWGSVDRKLTVVLFSFLQAHRSH